MASLTVDQVPGPKLDNLNYPWGNIIIPLRRPGGYADNLHALYNLMV
jgi:hypothetical protein